MGIQKKPEVSYNKMNRTALILFALFGLTMAMDKAHHKAKMIGLSRSECPNPEGTGKVDPCPPGWSGDGICDDFCNNEANGFDGGDCCGDGPWYAFWFCTVCECLE